MPVYVEANAPDSVGNRLVYAIREGIRRSSAMTLVDREQDGFISLKIVTLNPDESNTSLRTVYSIVGHVAAAGAACSRPCSRFRNSRVQLVCRAEGRA
jgi:hypothetical protein